MTLDTLSLKKVMTFAPVARLDEFVDFINSAATEFLITEPRDLAAWLANLAHESGEFRYMEELASGNEYESRADLGNMKPEAKACAPDGRAGPWFKGHGPIQITGYDNHRSMSLRLFNDPEVLLKEPRKLCEPETGCRAAGAFWHDEKCSEAASGGNFLLACQIVNVPTRLRLPLDQGGRKPNHYEERLGYYHRALALFGLN